MYRIVLHRPKGNEHIQITFDDPSCATRYAEGLAAKMDPALEPEVIISIVDTNGAEVACTSPIAWRSSVRLIGDAAYSQM